LIGANVIIALFISFNKVKKRGERGRGVKRGKKKTK
jgi:hypothetical protein